MSSDKHDGNANKHEEEGMPKQSGSKENSEKSKEESVCPDTERDNKDCSTYHPHDITINIPEPKDKWTIGTWIAFGTGLVTLAYFIATVGILWQTGKSGQTADSTFKEIRKEFANINQPFLEISPPAYKPISIGSNITADASIRNLGKYPAKVIKGALVTTAKVNQPNFDDVYEPQYNKESIVNEYISESKPITFIMDNNKPLIEGNYKFLKNGFLFYYCWGYIKYENILDSTVSEYRFMLKFNYATNALEYIINDNKHITQIKKRR